MRHVTGKCGRGFGVQFARVNGGIEVQVNDIKGREVIWDIIGQ
jgi:hypothetical protein